MEDENHAAQQWMQALAVAHENIKKAQAERTALIEASGVAALDDTIKSLRNTIKELSSLKVIPFMQQHGHESVILQGQAGSEEGDTLLTIKPSAYEKAVPRKHLREYLQRAMPGDWEDFYHEICPPVPPTFCLRCKKKPPPTRRSGAV